MTEHPEFPNESPAIKYIVDQAAKIDDVHGCSIGYYHSVGKILTRLDKTDTLLSQLNQTNAAMRKITDSGAVAAMVGRKTDEINDTLSKSLDNILVENVKTVSAVLAVIRHDNNEVGRGFVRVIAEIEATNAELRKQVAAVDGCLVIPSWQALVFGIALVAFGFVLGGLS